MVVHDSDSELYVPMCFGRGNSMKDAVSKAYTQIFNSYHGWALRKAVAVRLHYLPTKQQLYRKLREDGKYNITFVTIILNVFRACYVLHYSSYDIYLFFFHCIML